MSCSWCLLAHRASPLIGQSAALPEAKPETSDVRPRTTPGPAPSSAAACAGLDRWPDARYTASIKPASLPGPATARSLPCSARKGGVTDILGDSPHEKETGFGNDRPVPGTGRARGL